MSHRIYPAMSRTKGSKDSKPRRVDPLPHWFRGRQGYRSERVRVYGPSSGVRWFCDMTTEERGALLATAQEQFVRSENGSWVLRQGAPQPRSDW